MIVVCRSKAEGGRRCGRPGCEADRVAVSEARSARERSGRAVRVSGVVADVVAGVVAGGDVSSPVAVVGDVRPLTDGWVSSAHPELDYEAPPVEGRPGAFECRRPGESFDDARERLWATFVSGVLETMARQLADARAWCVATERRLLARYRTDTLLDVPDEDRAVFNAAVANVDRVRRVHRAEYGTDAELWVREACGYSAVSGRPLPAPVVRAAVPRRRGRVRVPEPVVGELVWQFNELERRQRSVESRIRDEFGVVTVLEAPEFALAEWNRASDAVDGLLAWQLRTHGTNARLLLAGVGRRV